VQSGGVWAERMQQKTQATVVLETRLSGTCTDMRRNDPMMFRLILKQALPTQVHMLTEALNLATQRLAAAGVEQQHYSQGELQVAKILHAAAAEVEVLRSATHDLAVKRISHIDSASVQLIAPHRTCCSVHLMSACSQHTKYLQLICCEELGLQWSGSSL